MVSILSHQKYKSKLHLDVILSQSTWLFSRKKKQCGQEWSVYMCERVCVHTRVVRVCVCVCVLSYTPLVGK